MVIKVNIFQKIKNEVSFRAGITSLYPNLQIDKRSHQRWKTRCVFHGNDTEPSLVFYENGYYCFGCGAKGDLVSFVANHESLTPLDAALRIADEFGITINTVRRPPTQAERQRLQKAARERELREAFDAWKRQMFLDLCRWQDAVRDIFDEKKLDVDTGEAKLIHWLPYVEHLVLYDFVAGDEKGESEKLEMFKNYLDYLACHGSGNRSDSCPDSGRGGREG